LWQATPCLPQSETRKTRQRFTGPRSVNDGGALSWPAKIKIHHMMDFLVNYFDADVMPDLIDAQAEDAVSEFD
jgi:hypothetical protein